jgi:hypothetical protein
MLIRFNLVVGKFYDVVYCEKSQEPGLCGPEIAVVKYKGQS